MRDQIAIILLFNRWCAFMGLRIGTKAKAAGLFLIGLMLGVGGAAYLMVPDRDANPLDHAASACGVSSISSGGESFVFTCIEPEGGFVKIGDATLPDQVECTVYFNSSGMPDQFGCQRSRRSLDAAIASTTDIEGEWVCEGFIDDTPEVRIRFDNDGRFHATIPMIGDTISVWRVSDADLFGMYSRSQDGKSLLLEPRGMVNKVIESAGLVPEDAPRYFMKRTQWDLRVFTGNELKADSFSPDETAQWIEVVNCWRAGPPADSLSATDDGGAD